VWLPPHIVAAPQGTIRDVALHSSSNQFGEQHRVISNLTAAQMKMMLHQVVLRGTGRKAQLDGYNAAGKTGTAQKVDPSTGAYSRSKYVASFAGFAPLNNPALTVAIILDSAVGLHQGGQVCAPVFQRVMQQALEHLNVPHDAELSGPSRRVLRAKLKDSELDEASPDRLSGGLELADAGAGPTPASPSPAAMPSPVAAAAAQPAIAQPSGTVVLDVESGGVTVPSLLGKPVRAAVELAQEIGLEIEVIGQGMAREQVPAPGTRIAPGGRVAVRFSP
jgi:cell division protein FtsI (penicillin-binding protein 3)